MKLDAPEITIFTNMPHTHESAAQGGPSTAPETIAAAAKATPVDADQLPLVDSAASNVLKKLTWVNVKATLKTYFDTLYTNNTGTVTNVSALTLGTTGTNLSSTIATGTTTPVITLQVPNASATNRGALIAADWTTFNSKQAGGTYVTPTTLNNNTLPASVTNLTTSGTNTMSALGAGIATFSAAGVVSSTATTGTGNVALTSSGTWTPIISEDGGGVNRFTATSANGTFRRTGNMVTITCVYEYSSIGVVGNSYAFMTGLPFTSANNGVRTTAAVFVEQSTFSSRSWYATLSPNGATLLFRFDNGDGNLYAGAPYAVGTSFPAAGTVLLTLTYFV